MSQVPAPPFGGVPQIAIGFWASKMLYAFTKLGVPDLLASGVRTVEELAQRTQTQPRALFRLLRALTHYGLIREDEARAGEYSLTPTGEFLRSDNPSGVRTYVLMSVEEPYAAWGQFLDVLRTGKSGFELAFGKKMFDYFADHPEAAQNFHHGMSQVRTGELEAVLAAYDFSDVRYLVDIGGGAGQLLARMLPRYPQMRGVLFETPEGVAAAKTHPLAQGSRCEYVSGNFFESVPSGADVYVLEHVVQDWQDAQASALLRNIRAAMRPESRVLLVEGLVPAGNQPGFAKIMDLHMMVASGGQERTEAEYRALLKSAGLELRRIIPTSMPAHIFEAIPA